MYDASGYLVPDLSGQVCRYAIHSSDQAIAGQSAVTILLQQIKPTDPGKVGFWLPTPPGNFNLILCMYWPMKTALQGKWVPPPVEKQ